MRFLRNSLIAALVVAVFVATPVWAQETGSMSGTVTDPDGAPLPGVAVTIGGTKVPASTVYTQANGAYRFPVLPPAEDYSLTFALEGFKTVVQDAIAIRVGSNTEVSVTMELSSVEETVTVTGSAPIVDVKKTEIGGNVTEQYMQSIPSARDPWVMMEHTAGMQVNKENIGGSEGGQQSSFTANGARGSDAMWTYDGAEVTDMAAVGASPMYYDFDAFEEIAITTGGSDPSVQSGGIRINFVTKRGGNRWQGSSRFYLTDGDFQAHNVADPDTGELTGNFTEDQLYPGYIGNSINNIKDWGAELGGPLVRDRFFVWGSYGKQDIKQNVGISPDNTQLKNWHGKANWHIGDKAVLNYTFVHADKTKQGRGASATRPPATTWNQGGPSPVHTPKIQYTINDNNYVEGSFNYTGLGFFLEPQGGRSTQPTYNYDTGAWGRSYYFYDTKRPLYNVRVDGNSYLAGANVDHELKYGYSYRDAEVTSLSGQDSGAIAVYDGATPVEAWLTQNAVDHYLGKRHSVYLGDTISAGRFTINAGLRYDHQTSVELPSGSEASKFAPDQFPANTFNGNDPGFGWNSLSPRFGVTYDLSGDSTTIVRVTASRYYAQMASWELQYLRTTGYREIDFTWSDPNGNAQVDPGEAGDILWISGGWDPANPTAPSPNVITETTAPWTNELIVGLEHEINRSFGIGANFIYRKNGNENWAPRAGEDNPAFWEAVTQDIEGYGTITVYQPTGPRATGSIYQERNGYSDQYTGVELFLNKRFSNRWMGNASFTLANPKVHYEPGGYTDPTNIGVLNDRITSAGSRTGAYWGAARWYLKGSAMYQLPAGFSVAGFFQIREGNILAPYVRSDNRANGVGRVNVIVDPFGSDHLPTYWDLDLRAEKTFDIQDRAALHLIVDAFNLTNNDIVLAQQTQLNSSVYGSYREIMQGRTIRFGARLVLR